MKGTIRNREWTSGDESVFSVLRPWVDNASVSLDTTPRESGLSGTSPL